MQEHPDRVYVAVLALDDVDRHKVTTVLGKDKLKRWRVDDDLLG